MYVEVAFPIPSFKSFTYKIHPDLEHISPGQRIIARFRNRNETGIIINTNVPKFLGKAHTILEKKDSINLLNQELLRLAKILSKYYFTSLGITLDCMLRGMSEPKRSLKKSFETIATQNNIEFFNNNLLSNIKKSLNKNTETLVIDEQKNPDMYIHFITENILADIPIILMVPDIRSLDYWEKKLSHLFPIIIKGNMSPVKKFRNWRDILNSKSKLILGTRQACFSPVSKKGIFIVFDEESPFYNEEIGLHYNAVEVCKLRCQYFGWKMISSTPTPSIKSYSQAVKKIINIYPQTVDKKNIIVKKLLKQRTKHDSSFMELIHRTNTLNKNEYAVLLSTIGGYIKRVSCGNCGKLYKCNKCGSPLSFDKKNLICDKCGFPVENNYKCTSCNEFSPRFTEFGREGLKKVCEELLGNSNYVQLLNNSSEKVKKGVKIVISPFNIYSPLNRNCRILGLFYPDRFLFGESLLEMERFYQVLRRGFLFTARSKNRSLFVFFKQLDQKEIQERDWISNIDENGKLIFYERELLSRKRFDFPPFSIPYTLNIHSSKQEILEKETHKIKKIFSKIKEKTEYKAFPDFPGLIKRRGNSFSSKTIFYLKSELSEYFSEMLYNFISNYSGRLKIEVSRKTP